MLLGNSEGKLDRYICLISRKGDHVIFIYSSSRVPCLIADDLCLEAVFPVDNNLQYTTDVPKKGQGVKCLLGLRTVDKNIHIELNNDGSSQKLFLELKRTSSAYSVTSSMGLPSSFSWLEKYQTLIQGSPPSPQPNDNPFANDVFDPLRYMNVDPAPPEAVPAKKIEAPTFNADRDSGSSGEGTTSGETTPFGFDNNFTDSIVVDDTPSNLRKSLSKDSLDNLDQSDMTDSLSRITNQLGLGGSGVELVEGIKPATGRENIVRHLMNQREEEFTHKETLKVFCGTWNVNGQSPVTGPSLRKWLDVDKECPDIFAIGFQELDLSNQAYIFSDSAKETEWLTAVRKSLPAKTLYKKSFCSDSSKNSYLLFHIVQNSRSEADYVATGIMGIMGNKGGVGVRFTIQGTSICFINSHLAAHQEEFERRNQDYRDISSKMKFKQFVPPLNIREHDVIFWIGDLNYRITDLDIGMVKTLIEQKQLRDLRAYDQLHRQLGRTDVFEGYQEGDLDFQPTYKYDPGTDTWDTSEKGRAPAWCDRVLFKGPDIRLKAYRCHQSLKVSDHKPVSALFDVDIKVIDDEKSKRVYEDIMKQLDRLENEYLPQVKLSKTDFNFSDLKFMEPQVQSLIVENTGQVPVTFEFIKKLDETSHCRNWMEVTPSQSVVVPGEGCEIQLKAYVDENSVGKLSSGEDKVEDILVLHLHGGKDFFITVGGSYIPSSFGSSIQALIQMHGPIREVPVAQLIEIEQPGSLEKRDLTSSGGRLYAIPKEIWRLVDHIWKVGKLETGLFERSGLQTEVSKIRDCLDTGVPDSIPGSIHSVAATLLLFLKCLPDPVIPCSVYQRCLECSRNYMLCKQVIAQIPECHRNVFRYLCAFLRELLSHSSHNSLDVKLLATTFGKIFLRPPPAPATLQKKRSVREDSPVGQGEEDMKRAAFVYHFLTNEYDE
ncbi:inositol polyphosphate 5-phosphatase OCRL-like [Ylistrum balloti]|uniref:inositol polyphosphate 5-phosphatase OCRL-like n=1 Tax=Ylistrum balloti TaxID=509963 RepID=UPI002905CF19|nr:inositol polyphosphate 5-phosphatase OCRL-like [Ylistrum balloti]